MTAEEVYRIAWIQGRQNPGQPDYLHQAQQGQGQEPEDHDGTEDLADALRSLTLDQKEAQYHPTGKRQDKRLGCGGGHIQALHGGEHGNDWSDEAFAAQQRGPEDGQEDQQVDSSRVYTMPALA